MRLMTALSLGLALALAVFGADPAQAGNAFQDLDADKDGKITLQEYIKVKGDSPKTQKNFKFLDANSDGVLTKEDTKGVLRLLDLDGNGQLSKIEYVMAWESQQQGTKSFQEADLNHDGQLNMEEFSMVWVTIAVGQW